LRRRARPPGTAPAPDVATLVLGCRPRPHPLVPDRAPRSPGRPGCRREAGKGARVLTDPPPRRRSVKELKSAGQTPCVPRFRRRQALRDGRSATSSDERFFNFINIIPHAEERRRRVSKHARCRCSPSFRRSANFFTRSEGGVPWPLGSGFRACERMPNPSFRGAGTAREPGTHEHRPAKYRQIAVFLGSRPAPAGHPGMKISSRRDSFTRSFVGTTRTAGPASGSGRSVRIRGRRAALTIEFFGAWRLRLDFRKNLR
jgi:hypothetical protein